MLESLLGVRIVLLLIHGRSDAEPCLRIFGLEFGNFLESPLSVVPTFRLSISNTEHQVSLRIPGIELDGLFEAGDGALKIVLPKEKLLAFHFRGLGRVRKPLWLCRFLFLRISGGRVWTAVLPHQY